MNIVIIFLLIVSCVATGYCLGRVHEMESELKEEEKWRSIEKNS